MLGARGGQKKRAPLKSFSKAAHAAANLPSIRTLDIDTIDELGTRSPGPPSDENATLLNGSDERPAAISWWQRLQNSLLTCGSEHELAPRTISFTGCQVAPTPESQRFPANIVRNQQYSVHFKQNILFSTNEFTFHLSRSCQVLSFVPVVLFNQFRFFFNLYFLLVAMSQFIPVLQVGFLFTYIAPLGFVLSITMLKEAIDDFARYRRDTEANSAVYTRLTAQGTQSVASCDIKVGDILRIGTNQRVPADCVLLRAHDASGTIFIRTDQLDGETDWKLRLPVPSCQALHSDEALFAWTADLNAQEPTKEVYQFLGNFTRYRSATERSASIDVTPPMSPSSVHLSSYTVAAASQGQVEPLSLENTMWANTVVATGQAIACVVYTGIECRAAMNAQAPSVKTGLLDLEINRLTKLLFLFTLTLAAAIVGVKGLNGLWYIDFFRFVLIFSTIIPISLRVNLDMSKILSSYLMSNDDEIPGTVVRNTSIPEDLGRIDYLFSDKTGTLTQNHMLFQKLALSSLQSYDVDSVATLCEHVALAQQPQLLQQQPAAAARAAKTAYRAMLAIAICHNVTPVGVEDAAPTDAVSHDSVDVDSKSTIADQFPSFSALQSDEYNALEVKPATGTLAFSFSSPSAASAAAAAAPAEPISTAAWAARSKRFEFQAASPDEVALVKFAESIGLRLFSRGQHLMQLESITGCSGDELTFDVLQIFPFTSESKRMGIIVRSHATQRIVFYLKGAESIMKTKMRPVDWLDEECDALARKGLRTLVFASKELSEEVCRVYFFQNNSSGLFQLLLYGLVFSPQDYASFASRYAEAAALLVGRDAAQRACVVQLEHDLEIVALTGVEDALQVGVREALETLRQANIKVWMLTGDKAETAMCIGRAAKLCEYGQEIFTISGTNRRDLLRSLDAASAAVGFGIGVASNSDMNSVSSSDKAFAGRPAILIDGTALALALEHAEKQFMEVALEAPAVICCRCSPLQKSQVVTLARLYSGGKRCAAIGDGGNDVPMIVSADVGLGIVGKEGQQASLAADVSLSQFSHVTRCLLWHGRNAYRRSARLSHFVVHRGLIISVMQAVFSFLFFYAAISIFNGWLQVGYATVYTMFPVFSLVLDQDVPAQAVFLYPELYLDMQKGRELGFKTVFLWALKSVYQGGMIMILSMILFEDSFINIVGITFTALILCELLNVAFEIHRWNAWIAGAELLSLTAYIISIFVLRGYFDLAFVLTWAFIGKTLVLVGAAVLPTAAIEAVHKRLNPPSYAKIQ
jgi:phospholipid-translocating ATPase